MRLSVVPDLALALAFVAAWLTAGLLGPAMVSGLVLTMELEAVAILAAFCITGLLVVLTTESGVREKLSAVFLGLLGVAWVLKEGLERGMWWPALIAAGLIGNRVVGLATGELRSEDAKIGLLAEAVWAFGIYAAVVGVSLAVAVPSLGPVPALPAEHARWCAFPGKLAADVFETTFAIDWCTAPHRALAAGALYYMVAVWRDVRRVRQTRRAR